MGLMLLSSVFGLAQFDVEVSGSGVQVLVGLRAEITGTCHTA